MSPLTREEHPCWVPTCDFCGCADGDAETGCSFHYASEHEAREALEGADWQQLPDGRWQCMECYDQAVAQGGEDG